ncbi:MAG: methyltransferase domain-containing protein [Pseudomonadota bacterium]
MQFARWLTGAEHLHYGLWNDLAVNAGNVGRAQAAYTQKLLGLFPGESLKVLDVGGGAGETAGEMGALGHTVDIVTPSKMLAERCRVNAPKATTHQSKFEDFTSDERFDLALFSESFQYIPPQLALAKACQLINPGGHVLISDCFRSDRFERSAEKRAVGGGHAVANFQKIVADMPLETLMTDDITEAVAPSIDIEQGFYKILGTAVFRYDEELLDKRPKTRWLAHRLLRLLVSERRRNRLLQRLQGDERTSDVFLQNNRYLQILMKRV